jgi:hypothetical protein
MFVRLGVGCLTLVARFFAVVSADEKECRGSKQAPGLAYLLKRAEPRHRLCRRHYSRFSCPFGMFPSPEQPCRQYVLRWQPRLCGDIGELSCAQERRQ